MVLVSQTETLVQSFARNCTNYVMEPNEIFSKTHDKISALFGALPLRQTSREKSHLKFLYTSELIFDIGCFVICNCLFWRNLYKTFNSRLCHTLKFWHIQKCLNFWKPTLLSPTFFYCIYKFYMEGRPFRLLSLSVSRHCKKVWFLFKFHLSGVYSQAFTNSYTVLYICSKYALQNGNGDVFITL